MPTLNRVLIRAFRHVANDTDLTFDTKRNVILGQNGTGKTTLLKLISVLTRNDLTSLASESFDLEWWMSVGSAILHVRARNLIDDRPAVGSQIPQTDQRIKSPGGGYRLSYELTVKSPSRTILEVNWSDSPSVVVLGKRVAPHRFAGSYDLTSATYLLVEEISATTSVAERRELFGIAGDASGRRAGARFDEALGFFDTMTRRIAQDTWGRLAPSITLTELGGHPTMLNGDLIPIGLLSRFFDQKPSLATMTTEDIVFTRKDLPALASACEIMGFTDGDLIFSLVKRDAGQDSTQVTFGNPRFLFKKADGSIIPDGYLSYGQKRLLSFLYYLAVYTDVAVVDELVNGFHYDWIAQCLTLCEGRQVFLTSQNPLLLDSLVFEDLDEAKRTFITCRTQADVTGLERVCWRNISPEGAITFYSSLNVGFQSVSEILRNSGLW